MLGGIYTDEKCSVCGAKMTDNGRSAVSCPTHKNQKATQLRVCIKMNGQLTRKRFTNYEEANRFLTGLRYKIDEGSFDARDYESDTPLGFANLIEKWLQVKKEQLKPHSWDNLNNYAGRAIEAWGNKSIKEIGYAEMEDFLFINLKDLSSKSRSNASSVLRTFWGWLKKRRVLHSSEIPDWPEVSFELEFRNTVDKATQDKILEEVKRISYEGNPRIWIGVKWLSTYFSIRPGEMVAIKEGHIDIEKGFIIIPHPKEKKPKIVPMIDEDVEIVKSLPRSFPELPFFRHIRGHGGATPGSQFGPRYFWKWWKKACENLGIKEVDLYGGTKHSTIISLGEHFTPEELKQASMHSTNKAFERYYRMKPDAVKSIYEKSRGSKGKPKKSVRPIKGIRPSD